MKNLVNISHCRITQTSILVDGKTVFKSDAPFTTSGDLFKKIYRSLGMDYKKFFKMDTLSQAAIIGTEYLSNSTAFDQKYTSEEIGLVFGNKSSSLATDRNYHSTISGFPSPGLFVYTLPNISIGEVAIKHKISGENVFFVLDEYDDELFENYVDILMANDSMKCCIAGWLEVSDKEVDVHFTIVEKQNTSA